jgi:hypothetical protein
MKIKTEEVLEVINDEEFVASFDNIEDFGSYKRQGEENNRFGPDGWLSSLIGIKVKSEFLDVYGGDWEREGKHYDIFDVLSLYSVKDNPVDFKGCCTDTQYRNMKKEHPEFGLETIIEWEDEED